MRPQNVDQYILNGCGRCELGGTPQCKVHQWTAELESLRAIVLTAGLTEEVKWGNPCYTFKDKNVAMIGAFKESCTLSFFKGALIKNDHGLLQKPGENTQAGRVIRFLSVDDIAQNETVLRELLSQAIEIERRGKSVEPKVKLHFPAELKDIFDQRPEVKRAFDCLTPGRQRGYIIHFSQPKQPKTRTSRIVKCIPKILEGRGFYDR